MVPNRQQVYCAQLLICPHWENFLSWDPLILHLQVLGQSSIFVHCEVTTLDGNSHFLVTFVYGSNNHVERNDLWLSFQQTKSLFPMVI